MYTHIHTHLHTTKGQFRAESNISIAFRFSVKILTNFNRTQPGSFYDCFSFTLLCFDLICFALFRLDFRNDLLDLLIYLYDLLCALFGYSFQRDRSVCVRCTVYGIRFIDIFFCILYLLCGFRGFGKITRMK